MASSSKPTTAKNAKNAKRQQASSSSSALKQGYLVVYNFASAIAWLTVLGRVVAVVAAAVKVVAAAAAAGARGTNHDGPLPPPEFLTALVALSSSSSELSELSDWTKWTQTMAGMEILHAAFGVVRAPLITTLIQVFSRYLLVWGVVEQFPYLALSPGYTSMLLAWSITEVIRYSYFALALSGVQPRALTWLRYNTFFLLYPVGILSECWLIYQAVEPSVDKFGDWYSYALIFILGVYVPGSYVMYSHMMAQRRKVARGSKEKSR